MRNQFRQLWLWLLPLLLVLGCESPETESQETGTVRFIVSLKEIPKASASRKPSGFPQYPPPDPGDIRKMKIKSSDFLPKAEVYYVNVRYDKQSDQLFIDPLPLQVKAYTITELQFLTFDDRVIYACPNTFFFWDYEDLIGLVERPLPFDIHVGPGENNVHVEAVPILEAPLEYFSYLFPAGELQDLTSFALGVYPKDSTSGQTGTYNLKVVRQEDGFLLYEKDSLPFGIRRITFNPRDSLSRLTRVMVSSEGYAPQTYCKELINDLALGTNSPFNRPINLLLDQKERHFYDDFYGAADIGSQEEFEKFAGYGFTHVDGLGFYNYYDNWTPDFSLLNTVQEFGFLGISDFNQLTDINGFANLRKIRGLLIEDCSRLRQISAFQEVKEIEYLSIRGCDSLTSLQGFSREMFLDNLTIDNCPSLYDFCPLPVALQNYHVGYVAIGHPETFHVRNNQDGSLYSFYDFIYIECR
ncbi:MAG: hypothetical protein MI784_07225 [Cytophagales bacterium]|nr:hypothetical protein [Cytophagales bacterium]